MINFVQLQQQVTVFAYLSKLIDYPQSDTFSQAMLVKLTENYPETKQKKMLLQTFKRLNSGNLLDQQTHFANLFEMNKRYTLYMSYYKMTDSRERGVVLAKLKMLYEMFGVSIAGSELADYLPMILEFLAVGNFADDPRRQDLQLAFEVIEDGTYVLLQNAVISADPYFDLIRIIRNELRTCVENEVKTK